MSISPPFGKRSHRIKVGIVSQDELDVGKKMQAKIADYLPDFEWHLKAKQATANHIFSTISRIKKVCIACHFEKMTDLNANVLLRWLQTQTDEGMGDRQKTGRQVVAKIETVSCTERP